VGLLAHLDPARQRELLDDLNYLNLGELHTFCRHHAIPYRVLAAKPDGGTTTTPDNDRKPVILRRVRHYLTTSTVPAPTCLPAEIVRSGPPAVLRPADRLYYRWYNKTYRQVIGLLAELTDGRFRNGALARVLIMEFWTSGEAPTFTRFAEAWSKATDEGRDLLTPEYAFLTDLHHGRATPEWKAMRQQKADAVLATLAKIERPIRPA
jgi:hypothetical protein